MSQHLHLKRYLQDKTILASLVSKAVREALFSAGKEHLFSHIVSFRLEGATVYLKTGKPIVNAELNCCSGIIREKIVELLSRFGHPVTPVSLVWK